MQWRFVTNVLWVDIPLDTDKIMINYFLSVPACATYKWEYTYILLDLVSVILSPVAIIVSIVSSTYVEINISINEEAYT